MKQGIGFILTFVLLLSCSTSPNNTDSQKTSTAVEGTWELISGTSIVKDDTSFTDYTKAQKMIKIINSTHFAFLRHDLNNGKDSSAIFESGGGRYTLTGNQYTEYLDYCNHREWEGHSFQFSVLVKEDTLIQSGTEKVEEAGVNRIITERYIRARER